MVYAETPTDDDATSTFLVKSCRRQQRRWRPGSVFACPVFETTLGRNRSPSFMQKYGEGQSDKKISRGRGRSRFFTTCVGKNPLRPVCSNKEQRCVRLGGLTGVSSSPLVARSLAGQPKWAPQLWLCVRRFGSAGWEVSLVRRGENVSEVECVGGGEQQHREIFFFL